jgi:hypothetical protein
MARDCTQRLHLAEYSAPPTLGANDLVIGLRRFVTLGKFETSIKGCA